MPPPPSQSAHRDALTGTLDHPSQSAVPDIPSSLPTPPLPKPSTSQPRRRSRQTTAMSSAPVSTRSSSHIDSSGRPFWLETRKDWDNDATDYSPSSMELLLRYYEIPGHWAYQHSGLNGGNTKKGSQKASAWLLNQHCPTKRTAAAVQNKVTFCLSEIER